MEGPVEKFLDQFADVRPVVGEGWAYVGFVGFLVLIFSLFRWGRYLYLRNFHMLGLRSFPSGFHRAFWASMLLAFFSFGWPFNWGLEFLLDLVPPVKQFRSLGRFAWVFYYVFSLYMAIYFYGIFRLMRQKGLGKLGAWMLFTVFLFWGGEMWIHLQLREARLKQYEHKNILRKPRFEYADWLKELGKDAADFQALLPVPAYFIGSEKFYSEFVDYYSTREGMSAAYQTGLPLACGLLSRTSISQTAELLQVMASPLLPKPFLDRYSDSRPLLLLGVSGVVLTGEEQRLLDKADLLGSKGNISLYSLPLERIRSQGDSLRQQFLQQKDSLVQVADSWYATDSSWYYVQNMDNPNAAAFEELAMQSLNAGKLELYRGKVPQTGDMEVSVWVKIQEDTDGFPNLLIQEYDLQGNLVNTLDGVTRFQTDTYKGFILSRRRFGVTDPGREFVITLSGRKISAKSLLIRSVADDLYRPLPQGGVMFNNYYIEGD